MGLCFIGLFLVAFSGGEETGNEFIGCFLTIVSAVFYALQIVFNYRFQKEKDDTFQLIFTQVLTAGIIISIISLIFEVPRYGFSAYIIKKEHIFNIIYLTVACTVFAQLAQILGQKWTTPAQTTIILSLESVFGALFSVLLGGEKLTLMLLSGFIVIFISVLITELKVDFVKIFSKKGGK
jgi:drug/metabolite transporter (DMT)-like permease